VGAVATRTSLVESAILKHASGAASVHIKMECEQLTGSFKVRGAVSAVASSLGGSTKPPATASTGNHAKGVLHACSKLLPGVKPEVFVPSSIAPAKLSALTALGASITVVDSADCEQAEVAARKWAEDNGTVFVSPYNDVHVIGGQGTIGLEILEQMAEAGSEPPQAVLVPVGGGGLIAGIAAAIKAVVPGVVVYGCQPATNCCMMESIRAEKILGEGHFSNGTTLSDGTAGGIEEGAITFPACMELVDHWLVADEDAILDGMATVLSAHGRVIEGAAGVAVACAMDPANRKLFHGKRVAVVVCGGNVSPSLLARVARHAEAKAEPLKPSPAA
jgi:threonine dehydratase